MAFELWMDVPPAGAPAGSRVQDASKPGRLSLDLAQMAALASAMEFADLLDDLPDTDDAEAGIVWPALESADEDDLAALSSRQNALVAQYVRAIPRPTQLTSLPEPERRFVLAYREAEDRARGGRSAHPGKVPAFKFASADDWWVQPAECQSIASGLQRAIAEDDVALLMSAGVDALDAHEARAFRELLQLWVAFNQLAARHGGYRVR